LTSLVLVVFLVTFTAWGNIAHSEIGVGKG
jgi:hypothetical protein